MTRLDADDALVRYPDFDSAVVKVLNGVEDHLTHSEADSIRRFLKPAPEGEAVVDTQDALSYADRILSSKRRKVSDKSSRYESLSCVLPTSNIAERLFSTAKNILTDSRKHMHPSNFEMIIFLRANKTYWNLNTLTASRYLLSSKRKSIVKDSLLK